MRHLIRPDVADALDAAAEALELEARRLRRRAADARRHATQAARTQRELEAGRLTARKVLASGAPLGAATRAIMAADATMPAETAIHLAQVEARAVERDRIARRNEEIMRLKRSGRSNAEIGLRLALHEKSVARIVGQMRRK